MIHIGVDFSLNSPAVCFNIDDKKITYYNIYRIHDKLAKREQVCLDTLKTCKDVEIDFTYTTNKSLTYNEKEHFHLVEAINLQNLIFEKIKKTVKKRKKDVYIVLEGFSYGSQGNRLAELAGAQYLLRQRLYQEGYKFIILSPKTIKMTAGNGNFNKEQSIQAFLNDEKYKNSDFRKLLTNKIELLTYKTIYEKPIDDFVDAYWGMRSVDSHIQDFGD